MISVVIPALNEERNLPACLTSLKNQQLNGAFELILVDNGSVDKTSEIAARYGATVIKCPRKGVAYARQSGAEAARGDIIAQADADTLYPAEWLGNIQTFFETHASSAGLAGRYEYVQAVWWLPFERIFRKCLNVVSLVFLRWPASVSGANFAFRRSAFIQAGGYDPASLYPDQWGIARRVSRFGRVNYDHASVVFTSSRRVAKPVYVIGYEIVRNCCHVSMHFVRHCVGLFKKPAGEPEAR
jgi:glycosyltransferase involved in cell wall biosynthesis